jgi:hypothetical protein
MANMARSYLALQTCLVLLFLTVSGAKSEEVNRPRLTINFVGFNPVGDGDYNANVGLMLQRADSPQINFNISLQHVRSLDEVYIRVRPAVDALADELRNAIDDFPKPH